jgi:hypothetical protein
VDVRRGSKMAPLSGRSSNLSPRSSR